MPRIDTLAAPNHAGHDRAWRERFGIADIVGGYRQHPYRGKMILLQACPEVPDLSRARPL